MRYRATIGIDCFVDSKEEAEKKIEGIILGLPNSFLMALSKMPHGSKISLVSKESTHQG